MLEGYAKVAFRNILKQKGHSITIIAGLATGMICSVLILLWVGNELSYDRFHENSERIYRLCHELTLGGNTRSAPMGSPPMGPAIVEEYPEVVEAVRFVPKGKTHVKHGSREFFEEEIFYTDPSIFRVFSFPMIRGESKSALTTAYSIILTETTAEKYFGEKDPIGEVLTLDGDKDYTVTGIIEEVPGNSHMIFDVLCSYETLVKEDVNHQLEIWGMISQYVYLLLGEGTDAAALEDKLPGLIDTHLGESLMRVGGSITLFLQPLGRIHLHSAMEGEISAGGDITYVYLFSIVALFILLIACINFVNLTTARSSRRSREVGIRKTVGATRGQLTGQFLGESTLYSFMSMVFALLLLPLVLPRFNSIVGKNLELDIVSAPWMISGLLVFVVLVGIIAGIYPALFLSSFQPECVLKSGGSGFLKSGFRRALVITQFVISGVLIIGTLTIQQQISFMKKKPLGFQKENVLVLPDAGNSGGLSMASLKDELLSVPGVTSVAAASSVPGGRLMMMNVHPEGFADDESRLMSLIDMDADFIPTLGMEMVAGRNFSEKFAADPDGSVIINETAARSLGWDDPVGKTISRPIPGPPGEEIRLTRTIVGVVKDFHFLSLRNEIEPMLIGNTPSDPRAGMNTIALTIIPDQIVRTLETLEQKWMKIAPENSFNYYFLEESLDDQYGEEGRLGRISVSFCLLSLFLACLGLLGLASYATEQRMKEIGIRKVFGASFGSLVRLLSREFLILVTAGNLIAWPIAYYGANRWLESFPYGVAPGVTLFLVSGAVTLIIAFGTVSYRTFQASRTDPIEILRYE